MLASTLPDFGSPNIPAFCSIAFGFVMTARAYWRGAARADVQWAGFEGAFVGAGLGFVVYVFALVAELY